MTGGTIRNPHIAQNQTSAEGRRGFLQLDRILHHRGVGEDSVDPKGGSMHAKRLQVLLGREAGGFAHLGSKVEDDQSARAGRMQGLGQFRDLEMREHAGKPRARTEDHPVGVMDGLDRLWRYRRVRRTSEIERTRPEVSAQATWPCTVLITPSSSTSA